MPTQTNFIFTTKQLQQMLKDQKATDAIKNSTTLKDETLDALNDLKDTKDGAIKMRQMFIKLFDDARYKEVKAISTHKTLAEKEAVAGNYFWCSYLKKNGDCCNKAKASAKGMYNHRLECRHKGRGDHAEAVEERGNIGTKKAPIEGVFNCMLKTSGGDGEEEGEEEVVE